MASPDFSIIGDLPNVYRESAMRANRERTLAELGQGANINDVARRLFQAGDIQGGLSLAQLGRAQAQDEWNRTYQGGMLDIARQNVVPESVKAATAAGLKPGTPEFQRAVSPRAETPISPTDKKAIFEAEDEVPQIQGTIEALQRAKELNSKTFTGYTAGIRGAIGTKVPGAGAVIDRDAALATEEWSKIMGPEALKTMAGTLKGATTDFELRKFIEMLADPSTEPRVRESVIDRLNKLAERKLQIQQARTKDLRSGTYFRPGADPTVSPSSAPTTFKDGQTATGPNGQKIIFKDGRWQPAR